MLELVLIGVGYVAVLFLFGALGGIGRAGEALQTWGARTSEKRRHAVERRLGLRR